MSIERRNLPITEVRVADKGGKRFIEGYAAKFDKPSVDLGGFTEFIRKGAFSETIRVDDVVGLFNHDPNHVLGRKSARTLLLAEDSTGLEFKIEAPKSAAHVVEAISRGDVTGCSFAFKVPKGGDRWYEENGKPTRELLKVGLVDVGPVTFPAYPSTEVDVRSIIRAAGAPDSILSRALGRRDEDEDWWQYESKARIIRGGAPARSNSGDPGIAWRREQLERLRQTL